MSTPLTWVVGAGGLLGSHVTASLLGTGRLFAGPPIPWDEPALARVALRSAARELRERAGRDPWQVIWCAGSGVIGATPTALRDELAALVAILGELGPSASRECAGALFLASSVGGLYAGGGAPPYDETSPVSPLSAYGEAKLEAEQAVTRWAHQNGTRVLIGRISNLYGPGQNLAKEQGLVSRICLAHLSRTPVRIWVPLDTRRDYLFVQDCAALIVDAMDRLWAEPAGGPDPVVVTKILASGRTMTVGAVIGELRRIFRRKPTIILSSPPTRDWHVSDLAVSSVVWPELDRRSLTPFPAGALATITDLRRRHQGQASSAPAALPERLGVRMIPSSAGVQVGGTHA